uniref:Putative tick transposon n=1 Tax=Rhipicephalus microplus TaxID=6941 RepID=A0A6G5ADK0_RHIMP
MKLGVSNTLDELIEATVTAQHQRLLGSKTGRAILKRLGYEPTREQARSKDIPIQIRDRIKIPPLPRNMNPNFHEGRRKARAEALQSRYTGRQDVAYTDAAEYKSKAAHTAVAVRGDGGLIACCTVLGVETVEAEEVSIALAISQKGIRVVISDSKTL